MQHFLPWSWIRRNLLILDQILLILSKIEWTELLFRRLSFQQIIGASLIFCCPSLKNSAKWQQVSQTQVIFFNILQFRRKNSTCRHLMSRLHYLSIRWSRSKQRQEFHPKSRFPPKLCTEIRFKPGNDEISMKAWISNPKGDAALLSLGFSCSLEELNMVSWNKPQKFFIPTIFILLAVIFPTLWEYLRSLGVPESNVYYLGLCISGKKHAETWNFEAIFMFFQLSLCLICSWACSLADF